MLTLSYARQKIIQRVVELATPTLRAVYDNPNFEVIAEQSKKGETLSIEFKVRDRDLVLDPLEEMGGGIVDILSLVLRLTVIEMLHLTGPLMLDEPFKFLSKDNVRLASEFLSQYSRQMNRQIILVTQCDDYIGDAIFDVTWTQEGTKIS